jgi:hypothetical protein
VSIGELLRVVAEEWNGRTHERLQREFRKVDRHIIQGAHQTPRKEPTSTAKLRIDLVHLSTDPKYSNALPSSPLRLRAACVPHALHPTDEFDAPSVRKDTQPENTRVQPSQGPLRSTSRISSLLTSMRVCTLGLAQKRGGPKAGVLKSLFHKHTKHRDQIRYKIM